ncbi:XdhC family protein [Thermoflavimicrobium dichotomicum]|uniref:Xanthine dehydrogenase accessory factor n=1 Tax=Thermoflavimicrobium dichotomicum TaxID=46223 RepID=A0A1I3S8X4_9BACL|nr:XdhC/CoxI family protein [Thermoflavimicrobium dichotomicum]SFJ53997.1 xanthine dehydrogenase accessory factor [Thermoflavimicrobium dichotomicum]
MNIFRLLINEIKRGRNVFLATVVGGSIKQAIGKQILYDDVGEILAKEEPIHLQLDLPHQIRAGKAGVHSVNVQGNQIKVMVEPLSPQPTLLVFGSGHIAESLVSIAKILSYQVIVIDDRSEYANQDQLPLADQIICGNFDEIMEQVPVHSQCYAVLATRSHQTDAICLSHLINQSLPYIGMVGSTRKIRSIFSLLRDRGLDPAQQTNIFAPVGLDIQSETPEEIALSILAEIQLIRFGGTGKPLSSMKKIKKVHPHDNKRMRQELDLFEAMANAWEEGRSFAAVTIIGTTGHVPRGIGSRMIVWEDGSICRTIGGGRRENEIIQMALECLKERKTYCAEADFGGSYDSFQPVCGGRFTYFIKPYVSTVPSPNCMKT